MAARCLGAAALAECVSEGNDGEPKARRTDADALRLLADVRALGHSHQGEMFDAAHLAAAAQRAFACDAHVEREWTVGAALRHLCAGRVLLVPYDAAPNHEPCERGKLSGKRRR